MPLDIGGLRIEAPSGKGSLFSTIWSSSKTDLVSYNAKKGVELAS